MGRQAASAYRPLVQQYNVHRATYAAGKTIKDKTAEQSETYLESELAKVDVYVDKEQEIGQIIADKDTGIDNIEEEIGGYCDVIRGEFGRRSVAAKQLPKVNPRSKSQRQPTAPAPSGTTS